MHPPWDAPAGALRGSGAGSPAAGRRAGLKLEKAQVENLNDNYPPFSHACTTDERNRQFLRRYGDDAGGLTLIASGLYLLNAYFFWILALAG